MSPPDGEGRPPVTSQGSGPNTKSVTITTLRIARPSSALPEDAQYSVSDLPPELADRITVDPVAGCWIWTGATDRDGYGRHGGRGVHRIVWELLEDPIPAGLVVDHREDWGCRSKACCWPGHLLPTTHAINCTREGTGVGAINFAKEKCGTCNTPYDLINTYWKPDGHRDCRRCIAHRAREYHQRVKAGQPVTRRTLGRAA